MSEYTLPARARSSLEHAIEIEHSQHTIPHALLCYFDIDSFDYLVLPVGWLSSLSIVQEHAQLGWRLWVG